MCIGRISRARPEYTKPAATAVESELIMKRSVDWLDILLKIHLFARVMYEKM